MKFIYKMEQVLIAIIGILFTTLLIQLLYKLRSALPWRMNCWFCNNNFWLKFTQRNCWICPKCEQYNGFTKDGDYNKPIFAANDQAMMTTKVFQNSPKNGLCKMCNINQQLKVAQLANFVPMNENNFDEEIDSYKTRLEKAYKLCSPCRKVLQTKLHKEKESLLGTKQLEARTPEKKLKESKRSRVLKGIINNTSMGVAALLLLIVTIELCSNITKDKNLYSTLSNIIEIVRGLIERIYTIIKMKTLMTFPMLEQYSIDVNNLFKVDMMPKYIYHIKKADHFILLTQEVLGGFVCLIQIIGHIWNVNQLKYTILIDLLWTVFVVTSIVHDFVAVDAYIMSLVKLSSVLAVLLIYMRMKSRTSKVSPKVQMAPKMKIHANRTVNSIVDDNDVIGLETDDDVSLSKFGLQNFSDSSNDTSSLFSSSLINGRSFTPRGNDSIWTKPKLNSTFCVNPVLVKSPSSVSDTVFIKPSFNKYQKLAKHDSDSDLDESISSLCIGSPQKQKKSNNSVFSLRKFTATPSFVAPTPLNARPLISPSKLGHSTSWVAGGYWGSEGERTIFNLNGSRSSSQSSGFESQASSMNQRNIFSQPSSREDSVCGEPPAPGLLDRFQNCNMSNYNINQPQNFSRLSSPVFPQMQYNGHVQIPQPRFPPQNFVSQNAFAQRQQYVQTNMFKAPGGSGLIRLPPSDFSR